MSDQWFLRVSSYFCLFFVPCVMVFAADQTDVNVNTDNNDAWHYMISIAEEANLTQIEARQDEKIKWQLHLAQPAQRNVITRQGNTNQFVPFDQNLSTKTKLTLIRERAEQIIARKMKHALSIEKQKKTTAVVTNETNGANTEIKLTDFFTSRELQEKADQLISFIRGASIELDDTELQRDIKYPASRGSNQLGRIPYPKLITNHAPDGNWYGLYMRETMEGKEDTYQAYRQSLTEQNVALLVPSDDGMLHILDEKTGDEILAYLPQEHHATIGRLSLSQTNLHYMKEQPVVRDAWNGNEWRTIAVTPLGIGGSAVVGFDVTDGKYPQPLWEINASDADFSDFGYVRGIHIHRLESGEWVAIFGNGHGKATKGSLYVVDLFTGQLIKDFSFERTGEKDASNAIGIPFVISGTEQEEKNYAEILYAGDTQGTLWRVDLSNQLSEAILTGASGKIVGAPSVARAGDGSAVISFATNNPASAYELGETSSIYTIFYQAETRFPMTASALANAEVTKDSGHKLSEPLEMSQQGWSLTLPEQVLGSGDIVLGNSVFITVQVAKKDTQESTQKEYQQFIYAANAYTGAGIFGESAECDGCQVAALATSAADLLQTLEVESVAATDRCPGGAVVANRVELSCFEQKAPGYWYLSN